MHLSNNNQHYQSKVLVIVNRTSRGLQTISHRVNLVQMQQAARKIKVSLERSLSAVKGSIGELMNYVRNLMEMFCCRNAGEVKIYADTGSTW